MPSKGTPPEIITELSIQRKREVLKTIELKKEVIEWPRRGKGRKVKFEEAFPIQEVCRGDPKERTSHMNVCLLWAVLDCGAAKSLAGAESAAMLAQACEKRGRKAGDDRKVEAVEEKYHCRGIGAQQKTSFIRLQVFRTLGGQNVHHAPSITDGTTAPSDGNDHLLPSVSR